MDKYFVKSVGTLTGVLSPGEIFMEESLLSGRALIR